MSKHNRERRQLWKLGISKKQLGRKATAAEIIVAKQKRIRASLEATYLPKEAS